MGRGSYASAKRGGFMPLKGSMTEWENLGDLLLKASTASKEYNKRVRKEYKIKKNFIPTLANTAKVVDGLSKGMKNMATMGLDMLGMFLQLGSAMGIMQPIMQMFQGVLGLMGGAAFQSLGPVLEDLAEFLFSDEMITFWEDLGTIIGDVMGDLMQMLMDILGNPKIQKLIITAVKAIGAILIHLGKVFGIFLNILADMDTKALGYLIFILAITIAFFKGMAAAPGVAGLALGSMMALMVGIALAPLLALASGGIVTRPTLALLGEGGEAEAVVPLSKAGDMGFGGGGESSQVLWATEDNGKKLDRLAFAIEEQNRIKRMKSL